MNVFWSNLRLLQKIHKNILYQEARYLYRNKFDWAKTFIDYEDKQCEELIRFWARSLTSVECFAYSDRPKIRFFGYDADPGQNLNGCIIGLHNLWKFQLKWINCNWRCAYRTYFYNILSSNNVRAMSHGSSNTCHIKINTTYFQTPFWPSVEHYFRIFYLNHMFGPFFSP